jgi:deoxyribonuclease-1
MKKFAQLITSLILICWFSGSIYADSKGNRKIRSFQKAKRILIREVYRGHQITFYCGSQYTQGKYVIHANGYVPKTKSRRARQLEWQHVVPTPAFGQSFAEWREGHPKCIDEKGKPFKGLNCAEKMNVKFRYMLCDLYNLVPSIGEINGLRANYSFAMIPGEKREFGECDMEIKNRKAEPPPEVRGNIARIYFYMDWAYSENNKKLFKTWDKMDPVDAWECERTKRIETIQKNENPFVKKACVEEGLWLYQNN